MAYLLLGWHVGSEWKLKHENTEIIFMNGKRFWVTFVDVENIRYLMAELDGIDRVRLRWTA